jgi:ATP-dependent DNA ligase
MLRREQAVEARRVRALAAELPAAYVAFDVLWAGGKSVMARPLRERQELLRDVLATRTDPRLILSDGVIGDGLRFFEEAAARNLEGVVAKRLSSPYLPGKRTDAWTKIKRTQRLYAAIIGFLPAGDDLKSLLIAVEDGGRLRYAGRVGTGWNDTRRAHVNRLVRARVPSEPIVPCGVDATRVEPGLYCTVDFLERTDAGELRAPVFVELLDVG